MDYNFEKMKRVELQRLAKKAGIKANMKTEKLIKALTEHHANARLSETSPEKEVTQNSTQQEIPVDQIEKPKECAPLQKSPTKETRVTPVQPRRRGRKAKSKPPAATSEKAEVVKSAQKRRHVDTESDVELPPAKRQNTLLAASSTVNVPTTEKEEVSLSAVESVALPCRRSSRKRTFSMSPTSSTTKKDQEEKKTVKESQEKENNYPVPEKEMTKTRRSSKGPENSDVSVKTASQKQESRKSNIPVKKTGIPLPKLNTTDSGTPGKSLNFKKVHKAHFEKLESIDDYLERKRKRIEDLTKSYKRTVKTAPAGVKKTPQKSVKTPQQQNSTATPKDAKSVTKRTSFFSPKPCPPLKQASKTKSVTFHTSKLKTPAKPAVFIFGKTSTEKRTATPGIRKSIAVMNGASARKSVSGPITPFKFGNTSMVSDTPSQPKKFDLKASLEKPLPYKPYTGKLKPLSEIQSVAQKPATHISRAKENLKKPKITSRQERQKAVAKGRSQKRKNNMNARRGLSVV